MLKPGTTFGAYAIIRELGRGGMGDVVLYECATGARPFRAESLFALLWAIVSASYAPPSEVNPEIDPALAAVITRAMALDASDRFPDMRSLAEALLPFASGPVRDHWREEFAAGPAPSSPGPASLPPSPASVVRRRPSRAWLPLAGAALPGVAGLVAALRPRPARALMPAVAPVSLAIAAPVVVVPVDAPMPPPVVVLAPPALPPPAPSSTPTLTPTPASNAWSLRTRF